jgi:cytochrome c-type biogenesis protein CcmF
VRIGVIMIAVALAASNGYTRVGEFTLQQGDPVVFAGHTFELQSVTAFTTDRSTGLKAAVSIDGGQAYSPAITRYTNMGTDIGTPSVRTGFTKDIYLTLEQASGDGATEATIKVFIKPMIVWLWIGGGLMAIGTVLAAFPGRRRRLPTSPVSSPIPIDDAPAPETPATPETPETPEMDEISV